MSKDANSFGHDKALAWESRGFVYTKKRMHRFDTPSYHICTDTKIYQLNVIYVSIFLILFMLLITFLSSKMQYKKSFVKCIRRKAGCSCDSVDFIYKSYPQPPISLQM